jgi:hypothetical protein
MIKIIDKQYKSIGNLLLQKEDNSLFCVKAPIDFLVYLKEGQYYLSLRYTNYNYTFDYESFKGLITTVLSKDNKLTVLHICNILIPDPDNKDSSSMGYVLTYKIRYNEKDKDNLLFKSFESNTIDKEILCQL